MYRMKKYDQVAGVGIRVELGVMFVGMNAYTQRPQRATARNRLDVG
jgi:hypothetical protein